MLAGDPPKAKAAFRRPVPVCSLFAFIKAPPALNTPTAFPIVPVNSKPLAKAPDISYSNCVELEIIPS